MQTKICFCHHCGQVVPASEIYKGSFRCINCGENCGSDTDRIEGYFDDTNAQKVNDVWGLVGIDAYGTV